MTSPPPPGPPGGAGDRTNRPRPRDNGLAAEHFVALLDLDPRIALPLLEALRRAGIAAYVAPTPGHVGGYLDVRLPERPTDRLWVDGSRRTEAREVVQAELSHQDHPDGPVGGQPSSPTAPSPPIDPFDEIVAGFHDPWSSDGERPWPAAEDIGPEDGTAALPPSRVVRPPLVEPPRDQLPPHVEAYLDEHFVPEPPPPLPRPAMATFWALVGLVGGLALLIGGGVLHWQLDPIVQAAAAFGILGGFATLVWRMRDTSGDDEDDGAVV
ncbi:MAG: hypothetical protein ACJ74O_06830 [Frankiaceae bacterium]